ncbi:MAG: hypothetical protein KGP14_01785 [Betaproteobacteria bacterium]|nr:hypothetical protein [Betaproteobacteria bacterium]
MGFGLGIIASSVIGGLFGSDAASTAADAQTQAAQQASQTQLQMFNQMQQNLKPWMAGGNVAMSSLGNLMFNPDGSINTGSAINKPFTMADYQQSPYAKWLTQQGENAIINNASATGMTGNTLKALSDYAQNQAMGDFWNQYNAYTQNQNNLYNRIGNISGMGQNAAAGVGNMGMNTANQIGSNIIGAGNATAAGMVGSANALSNGINGAMQNYMFQQMLNSSSGAGMISPMAPSTWTLAGLETSQMPPVSLMGG